MTTNTSSIVAAISDVAERVAEVVESAGGRLSADRLERLKKVKERADDLTSRGLLSPKSYSSPSPAQMQKLYALSKP